MTRPALFRRVRAATPGHLTGGMMLRFLPALLLAPLAATAQTAAPCDWQASAQALVEPWEDNSATFANGAVRVAVLDTVEPAAAAYYFLILSPPMNEVGDRTCTVVGFGDGLGYAYMDFASLKSGYDPARGLIFTIPARIYMPEESFTNVARLEITVNQATGSVTVTSQLGIE